ncbi:TIGR02530 family flagellar biosynthesis protein [Sporomusa sp. KB1]|jgi:flagellar operon protein|uniref:TIGR02530 family flagellar biosynthesis protein n=1 Tax=Sporomusa sp. KB1 TaxID=943346 RepID=UPI0011A264D2|nr:TIGR02530 family flagellar biosynthesis protein [Sporomusa sp. KB1]TWH48602.1 flagellar operon protein [Sporomusa sp. KB1]
MPDNRIYNSYQPLPTLSSSVQASNKTKANPVANKTTNGSNFNQLLQQEITGVKFSQHALQRLDSRKIQLDSTQLSKLSQAVEKAAQKGAKESLILMNDNLAFVVSVKNKTVITAMDGANIKDNVFTNIDSAVIV